MMSPKEAGALLAEPDWADMFADRGGTELAFENILREWRAFHWTPVGDKKRPAGATEGIIALALIGIMPPRSLPDRPPGLFEEQVDDHCWFVSEGRAWRVMGIEDRMLMLRSGFSDEERQINLDPLSRWVKYCEAHNAQLAARRK
jgi:hypothetical protein